MKLFLIAIIIAFISSVQIKADYPFNFNDTDGIFAFRPVIDFPADDAQLLLAQSEEAHFKHDIERAKELLLQALASNPTEEERATAEQRLATLEWRFYGQYEKAREHLARAETLKAKRLETFLEKAGMEGSLKNFDAAYASVQKAILEAKDEREKERAKITLAYAVVKRVLHSRVYQREASTKAAGLKEQAQIVEANKLLLPIIQAAPGQLMPSRLQVTLSLLLQNGPDALFAWRSFFHIEENAGGDSLLVVTDKKLAAILNNWAKTKNSVKTNESLALALADSRMFEEASLIALKIPESQRSPRIKDVIEYTLFCRRVQDLTNEYYRLTSLKKGNADDFKARLVKEGENLWNLLSWTGTRPKFEEAIFVAEMAERFGAVMNLGTTAGYFDLHMGHRVIDEKRTITQYKYSAEIQFVSLDTMISNGFQSWAWDGRAQHGGWGSATRITQVRPAYNSSFYAWDLLNDPTEKKRIDDEIVKAEPTDEATARQNPYAFLPGLRQRLLRHGREQLLQRVQAKGLTGKDLRLTFLGEYEKASVESGIFAHEGRHAIDAKLKLTLTADEREFRAKLSEIAFSSAPRLNIGSIFDANIGDNTPHGIANLKIMKGLVKWMEANTSSIAGLNPSKPLLLQFDLLTDEQIKDAFRSMDPFYET